MPNQLRKVGNSYYLLVPKHMIDAVGAGPGSDTKVTTTTTTTSMTVEIEVLKRAPALVASPLTKPNKGQTHRPNNGLMLCVKCDTVVGMGCKCPVDPKYQTPNTVWYSERAAENRAKFGLDVLPDDV